jgi:ABC-type transport system involved in cytochrome bd biosynthesis fused ATPase/permease subunit
MRASRLLGWAIAVLSIFAYISARSLAWMMWWTAVGVIAIVSNKPGGWTVPPQLILLIFLGILLALVGTLLTEVLARRRFEEIFSPLESKLQTSVTDLKTTQQEIETKQRIAQLQEDIERYRQLADQAKSAASVALLVQEEFRKGERRSLWTGFAMNFVFFFLGVGASFITSSST